MKARYGSTLLLLLFFCCASCAGLPAPGSQEGTAVLSEGGRFSDAHWGIYARSLKDGRVLWARNEHLHFTPASNLKLFTTAVSLLRLGPDYRYSTVVLLEGPLEKGILHGNLIVRASGDPTFSSRFRKNGAPGIFTEWADCLIGQGVQEIEGDIVIEEGDFDDRLLGAGWFRDDEVFSYSAQIGAFSIEDNCVKLRISANPEGGGPGSVEIEPPTTYVEIINQTRTAKAGPSSVMARRGDSSNRITLSGMISPCDSPVTLSVPVHDPSLFGGTVFKEALQSRGIEVKGRVRRLERAADLSGAGGSKIVTESPPLWAIVREVNKVSHNLSAELLLKKLGAVCRGQGSAENGSLVVKETLERAGIMPETIFILDGSGLSRLSLVTPSQVVALLEFMYHQPLFALFYDSLPIAGRDGTLAGRMMGTPAEKNVRAKTGFSTHNSSLSGYATQKDGDVIAFSIITNNNPGTSLEIRRLQDSICLELLEK